MKDYKRLTERDIDGTYVNYYEVSNEVKKWQEKHGHTDFLGTNITQILLERLADLEDKIENGTLVELPCKVGDKIYVCYGVCVDEWEVVSIQIYGYDILFRLGHKGTDDYNSQYLMELGETWFLTKAEAEAKLRELKEKDNEQR